MALNLTVFSPSAAQCETASLLWAGGRAPYSVSVVDARTNNGPTLASAGSSFNPRLEYLVTIPAGTLVKFRVIDSGTPPQVADSTLVSIRDSGDDSCLPASQQTGGGSTSSPSSTRSVSSTDNDDETSTDSMEPNSSADASTTRSSPPTGLSTTNTRSSRPSQSSSQPSATNTSIDGAADNDGSSAPKASGISGALVGGIAAGAIIIILLILGLIVWRKRRQQRRARDDDDWFATQPHANVGRANSAATRYNDDKNGTIVMNAVTPASRANSLRGLMERDPSYPATTDASTEDVHTVYAQNMNIPQVIVTRDSFIGDSKRPLNVLSAEDYSNGGSSSRPTQSVTQLPSAVMSSPSRSSASSADVQVPPQLSEAEMTRLADLVASRMRTADPEESPPVYHH